MCCLIKERQKKQVQIFILKLIHIYVLLRGMDSDNNYNNNNNIYTSETSTVYAFHYKSSITLRTFFQSFIFSYLNTNEFSFSLKHFYLISLFLCLGSDRNDIIVKGQGWVLLYEGSGRDILTYELVNVF